MDLLLSPYRFFKVLCFVLGLQVLVVAAVAAVGSYFFMTSLPDFKQWDFARVKNQTAVRIAARYEDKKIRHNWVAIKDISRDLLYSIVMSEDGSFFEHSGIDYEAMMSSLAENLKRREAAYGGSTISQQVTKNVFLTNEKSVTRKLKELLITKRMEAAFSKNEILELYLNLAEFGPDIYGVEAAAKRYFKKPPSEINALEGAFLAVLLPSPKRYHYAVVQNKNLTQPKRKKIRRILSDMLANEYISEKQYREYIKLTPIDRMLASE